MRIIDAVLGGIGYAADFVQENPFAGAVAGFLVGVFVAAIGGLLFG